MQIQFCQETDNNYTGIILILTTIIMLSTLCCATFCHVHKPKCYPPFQAQLHCLLHEALPDHFLELYPSTEQEHVFINDHVLLSLDPAFILGAYLHIVKFHINPNVEAKVGSNRRPLKSLPLSFTARNLVLS